MKTLISFGFKFGKPDNTGCAVIDIRPRFGRNPWHNKKLRYLHGDNPQVIEDILKTPDFEQTYSEFKDRVTAMDSLVVYIGCTGGHHRSVYIVNRLAEEMGWQKKHRDYFRR